MKDIYQDIKFPVKNCCVAHNQFATSIEETFKDKTSKNIQLTVQQIACNCGQKCWQNLFTFLMNRKDTPLKKLRLIYLPNVPIKKSAFEQIILGISQMADLQKLTIQIYFKNNFLEVISQWIQQMVSKLNKKAEKLSLKIYQIDGWGIVDDRRVAPVIQNVAQRQNIVNFSFSYLYFNENYDHYNSVILQRANSLQSQTLQALTQVLKTDCIRKMKINAPSDSKVFRDEIFLGSFCYNLKYSKLTAFTIHLDIEFYLAKSMYQQMEQAWLDNKTITNFKLSFDGGYTFNFLKNNQPTIVKINRFNSQWKIIKLSNCDLYFTQLPPLLQELHIDNPSTIFFSDLEIGIVGKTHQLQRLYLNSIKPTQGQFPSVIESYFQNLEVLEIKTPINNQRMLNYVQANTNLHTLKIQSFNTNPLNVEVSKTAIVELFQTISKCPHLTTLHLNVVSAYFYIQTDILCFGKYLEEFCLTIYDGNYTFLLKLFKHIFESLNYNSSLLKLSIKFKFLGYVLFTQQIMEQFQINVGSNDTLTQLAIETTQKATLPKSIICFQEKTVVRYISILQYKAFNDHIAPQLSYNPLHTIWDLYF